MRPLVPHLTSALTKALAGVCALAVIAPLLEAQGRRPAAPLASLDAYVTEKMKEWKVPGVAIAVVKDDSVVLARGYGVRTLGESAPVDANTIFAIGSASKAFTAALVAFAVDDGKMKWNERVTTYLPGYQLHDTYASRDLTIRDALSHRSGLARGDLMWYLGGLSRDEILQRTRYLRPSWGFRSQFGYQNLMYLAAGEAAARASGASWDELVRRRIFQPLGMTSSMTSVTELGRSTNVATPHAEVNDTVRAIRWKNIDNIAPAGSINSNVRDMAQWVRFQLGEGKFEGKQLLSSGNLTEMWQINTHIRLDGPEGKILFPNANLGGYGMGWFLQDFNGNLAVHHGGNIDGFSAMVAMLPAQKLGVVVLTNMDGTLLRDFLWAYIADAYTRGTPRDFSGPYRSLLDGMRKQGKAAEDAMIAARVSGTSPSLALEKYAGTYADSMYGDLTVTHQGGRLAFRYGIAAGTLEHWHYDTFRATLEDPRLGKPSLRFIVDAQGKASELKVDFAPEATFRMAPPKADSSAGITLTAEQLQAFTGKYAPDQLPLEVEVQLVGESLRLTVPGQPTYILVPETPTRFRMTGPAGMPAGFYFEFRSEGGRVTGATLEQPAPQPKLEMKRR